MLWCLFWVVYLLVYFVCVCLCSCFEFWVVLAMVLLLFAWVVYC